LDINIIIKTIKTVTRKYPAIIPHLSGAARWVAMWEEPEEADIKGVEDYRRRIMSLIRALYNGDIGGDFIDSMAALVSRQLTLAYRGGMADAGLYRDEITPKMQAQLDAFILNEFAYVDRLYRDVIDAKLEEAPIEQFNARAQLWANRYKEVENAARVAVAAEFGNKLIWKLGATEQHCDTCLPLNNKVAFAKEWELSGLAPQSSVLTCGGWNCDCSLQPTEKRRSPKVLDYLMSVPRK
jgi:hypothetical protein